MSLQKYRTELLKQDVYRVSREVKAEQEIVNIEIKGTGEVT